jgi:hypothetical protein
LRRTELYSLSIDRAIRTHERHMPNEFYGHASVLKRFMGMSHDVSLKAVVEHGAFLDLVNRF